MNTCSHSKLELQMSFIELRAAGRSYSDIAAALDVSKPTLLSWGKDLRDDVANARTLRLDELFETYAVAKTKRVEIFGKRLEGILEELDTRSLKDVPTAALLKLALEFGDRLKGEDEPLTMRGSKDSSDLLLESLEIPDSWPV